MLICGGLLCICAALNPRDRHLPPVPLPTSEADVKRPKKEIGKGAGAMSPTGLCASFVKETQMDHPAILSPRPPTEAPRSPVLGLGCIGWQFLALAVCVNGLSATQGWNISIDWPFHFGAEHRSTTAWAPVFFLLWLGAQLGLLLVTFEQLGRLQDQPPWLRMPSLRGFPNPSDSSRLGYGLHQALIVLVIVVSLFAGGHFLKKTLLASVECGPTICWFDSSEPGVGVEFFPPWETPAFIAAYFIVAILWTRALWKLVRKHKGPR